MAQLKAIVEMTGRDPFDLRAACEEFCAEQLLGEPITDDEALQQQIADGLLADYLRRIDPQTTGAGGLCVSVVCR